MTDPSDIATSSPAVATIRTPLTAVAAGAGAFALALFALSWWSVATDEGFLGPPFTAIGAFLPLVTLVIVAVRACFGKAPRAVHAVLLVVGIPLVVAGLKLELSQANFAAVKRDGMALNAVATRGADRAFEVQQSCAAAACPDAEVAAVTVTLDAEIARRAASGTWTRSVTAAPNGHAAFIVTLVDSRHRAGGRRDFPGPGPGSPSSHTPCGPAAATLELACSSTWK